VCVQFDGEEFDLTLQFRGQTRRDGVNEVFEQHPARGGHGEGLGHSGVWYVLASSDDEAVPI
jgi:hypothetical protein